MNEHQPSADHANPFGYDFASSPMITRNNSSSTQPPTGPPLLDTNEQDLLQNFFDNPNNVDPSFLQMPGSYGSSAGIFGDQNLSWVVNSGPQEAQHDQGGRVGEPDLVQHDTHHPSWNFLGLQPHAPVMYGSYAGTNHQSAFEPFHRITLQEPLAAPQPTNHESFDRQISDHDRPSGALKFGSDDTFCRAGYQGGQEAAPDRVFQATIKYNLDKMGDRPIHESKIVQPLQSPTKKRGLKQLMSASASNGDRTMKSESVADDQEPESKRRKGHIRIETGVSNEKNATKARPPRKSTSASPERQAQLQSRPMPTTSKPPRENLSEEQKRSNHIQSEQKRRNLIKQGFEDLNRMVPELRAGGFSKSNMLVEAAKFMERLQKDNARLKVHLGYPVSGIQ